MTFELALLALLTASGSTAKLLEAHGVSAAKVRQPLARRVPPYRRAVDIGHRTVTGGS
jgi:hypothetical protein